MTHTLPNEENFPTSAKTKCIAEEITAKTIEKLTQMPCGEALFCEQALYCDGRNCPTLHSER